MRSESCVRSPEEIQGEQRGICTTHLPATFSFIMFALRSHV